MASSVGAITFGVGVDASRVAQQIRAALEPALRAAQQKLNANPLKVKLEIDTGPALRAAQQKLNANPLNVRIKIDTAAVSARLDQLVRNRTANIRIRLQGSSAAAAQNRLNDIARERTARINLDFSPSPQQLAAMRAIQRLQDRDVRIRINIDMSTAELERLLALAPAIRAISRLSSKDIRIRIDLDVDEARLIRVAESMRDIRSRTVNLNVRQNENVDTSAAARVSALAGSVASVVSAASGIAAVAAGMAAIGGAAGLAAGAVGGLVAGLVAIGPAAAAIGATAVVGLSGIKDAFTALGNVSKNSASESKAQSQAIAGAQDQLASALDGSVQAQRALNNAQREASSAARDVGQAYKDAEKDLKKYQLTVEEASLDEREAVLALEEARKSANTLTFDPKERERAAIAVQRAEINLAKAQDRTKESQEQFTDAQRKGVENSDRVVSAKEKQRQADEQVASAASGVASANRQVAAAQRAVAEASNSATPSVEKFNQAMAQLSPNAQAFVLAAQALGPAWNEVKRSVQDQLFAGLDKTLTNTANVVLPQLKTAMGGVATELNAGANQFLNFLASQKGLEGMNASFANGANLLRGLRTGTGEFSQGIIDATKAATPEMEGLGRSIAGLGEGFGKALSDAAKSGEFQSLLNGLSQALQGAKPLIDAFIGALITIGGQVLPALKPLFESLAGVIQQIAPGLGQLGKIFAEQLALIMPDLGKLLTALVEGLKPILPILAELLRTVFKAVEPLLPVFSQIAQVVGKTLIDTVKALQPALVPLATAFADILKAVTPLIPLIAENLSVVIKALAPAISEIARALAPVIQQFVTQMKPVIEQLAPILAEVAKTIGMALAQAIQQIAPILPPLIQSFAGLLLALLPLIPQLMQIGLNLLPILIKILVDLSPVIIMVIDNLTWLVKNVIEPFVIPIILSMADSFRMFMDVVAKGISFLTNTAMPAIKDWASSVGNFFSGMVEGIRGKWASLREIIAAPINFVIGTVWNNGLLKAWNSIRSLLGGALPEAMPLTEIPTRATGGSIGYANGGAGNGTKDDILTWLSNGEHVVTSSEVVKAGGQNVLYAIRDMIARGVPFTWDNGKIISQLGIDNLSAYGAAVATQGVGNVPPEGLFDKLIPRQATGGEVMPWMHQLLKGHTFARAQNGKPYQWGGPRFTGDSFDCSGLMSSIAAEILGQNPWQRYWSTSSFGRGQRSSGPQGFTAGVDGGFVIGVTDDPDGPGGGHTAGVLGAIPELGVGAPARVESGGQRGDVHYNDGPDPLSFLAQYKLPIGANGFFQPGPGSVGGSAGPSVPEQSSFLTRTIERIVKQATDPVRELMTATVGPPPPAIKAIPPAILTAGEQAVVKAASGVVGTLGSKIGGAWQRAKDLGNKLNPFDNGGIANGTGFMAKNVIDPERVLNPEQTKLFEALVTALQSVAGGAGVAGSGLLTADKFQDGIAQLGRAVGIKVPDGTATPAKGTFQTGGGGTEQNGQILSDTKSMLERTASSDALVQAKQFEQTQAVLSGITNLLTEKVLAPVIQTGMEQAFKSISADSAFQALGRSTGQVAGQLVAAAVTAATTSKTTAAAMGGVLPGYTPGRDVHMFSSPTGGQLALSGGEAIMRPEWTRAVGGPAAVAAMNRAARGFAGGGVLRFATGGTVSTAGIGADLLGIDQSTVFGAVMAKVANVIVTALLKVIGIEIEVRDTMFGLSKDIRDFKKDSLAAFDENGQLISDTAALVERTATNEETVSEEKERISKDIIKGTIDFLVKTVLVPVLQALSSKLIQGAGTAIGAAVGGPAGAVAGAVAGAALGAVSGVLISVLGEIISAGVDAVFSSFDSGGVANGIGMMPKNVIAPERVLSPRQTESFDRLVKAIEQGGTRTIINSPFTVNGDRRGAEVAHSRLLSLLNS